MAILPWIGVSISKARSDGRWRHQCAVDYVQAVLAAGGWPVLLPAETILSAGGGLLAEFGGFLLSGGGDLDPKWYGQERAPATQLTEPARDQAELALASLAVEAGRPLLAICRGLQVLNVALNGDLYQDLSAAGYQGHDQLASRQVGTHLVIPSPGTLLAELMPAPTLVNSFHHQAVANLGKGLVAVGRSPDGLVEAVAVPGRPILGVQWHPESYADLMPEAARLFAWLVRQAGS